MNVVTSIELNVRGDRRSGISKLHGRNSNGTAWTVTEAEAIKAILDGKYVLHVLGSSRAAARVIVAGVWPRQFLKTEADDNGRNNLLALPEWPNAA